MEAGGRATQGRFGLLPSRDIGTSLYGRAVAEDVDSDRAEAAEVANKPFYAIEEPTSLNVIEILPALCQAGVAAIKVEGRQRSPAYVAQVTRVLRAALDACLNDPDHYIPRPDWLARLDKVAEGRCHTLGAYHRPWQ
ncbi:MAG: U32 family peptidase [Sulfuricaulis sp.]|nr:U32 family peptidase [Sulfuricaulis sp.]